MARRTWPEDERDEYEVACNEAWDSAKSTRERGERFRELVEDGVQAHRLWASDLLQEFVQRGAEAELKSWRNRTRRVVAVAHDGRLLNLPRVIGVKVRSEDDGTAFHQQELYDFLPFEQLEEKAKEYLSQARAYQDRLYVLTLLLELRELVPGATTPDEAARSLGTTVDAWLDERTAA